MEERLQKLLSGAGIASRRKSEELILAGRVKVNGETVRELGIKADFGKDRIEVDGKLIQRKERKIYVLLNKPCGYVCTVDDELGRPTVLDLLPDWGVRLYPVGRLDMDTSGLLIITNDGKMTNAILHPSREINKIYRAEVKGVPTDEQLSLLRRGLVLEDERFAPAKIRLLSPKGRDSVWEIIIHEGKKRQIRRMFKAIKHPVIKLERTNIDFLSTKGLKEGEWRFLKKEELRRLIGDVREKRQNDYNRQVLTPVRGRNKGNFWQNK